MYNQAKFLLACLCMSVTVFAKPAQSPLAENISASCDQSFLNKLMDNVSTNICQGGYFLGCGDFLLGSVVSGSALLAGISGENSYQRLYDPKKITPAYHALAQATDNPSLRNYTRAMAELEKAG